MMLGGVIRSFKFLQSIALLSLALVAFSNEASAQEEKLRVFANQYVIVPAGSANEQVGTVNARASSALTRSGGRIMKSLGKASLVSRSTAYESLSTRAQGGEVVDFDSNDDFCQRLISSGAASSCSPDYEIRVSATPNDTNFGSLWGMNSAEGIDAVGAWDSGTGSQDVVVAVIDTGVDYTHPDLVENMWVNTGEVAGNGLDDDANGYIDDVYGWNAASGNGNPLDDNGHGSHCAGTIGGRGNNGIGVAGVNWRVKIMALKFLNANGSGSLSNAILALNYMNTMKSRGVNVRVSSNSWGGGGFDQALFNAISRANELGIIFVAAAGNETNDNDARASYPGGYDLPNVVSVAAVDKQRNLATFSNYGANAVDIAAPGVGILSTYSAGRYATLSGTSMAAPHVSGAFGLLLSREPWLTAAEAIDRAYLTGAEFATLTGVVRTGRMINAARMVRNETAPLPAPAPTPAPCNYAVSALPFTPDVSANTAPVVIQADELGFHTVDLPFSFPYFGQQVSQITVSPNGVVYTNGAPNLMDYLNSSSAPVNAIAALHTDLTTQSTPHAVRVSAGSDKVTVYWLAEAYAIKGQGDIEAWLTLRSSGQIEVYVGFANATVQNHIQTKATLGITGASATNSFTAYHNAASLVNGTAIGFTPLCGDVPPANAPIGSVTEISLFGKASSGRPVRRVAPGKEMTMLLTGSGSGTVELKVSFNDRSCDTSAFASLNNGAAQLKAVLPKSTSGFSSMKLRSGPAKKAITIANTRARGSARSKRLGAKQFKSLCDNLFSSISSI